MATDLYADQVDLNNAIPFILEKLYKSEWRVIDKLNQHPDGLNFYEWLVKHNLVTPETIGHFEVNKYFRNDESN